MSNIIFNHANNNSGPVKVTILLIPHFSLIAFTSLIEPLRLANWLTDTEYYTWEVVSEDGKAVPSSSEVSVAVDKSINDVDNLDNIIVCGGINTSSFDSKSVFGWLRRWAREGCYIGSLCTGAIVLAKASLLKDYRCTIHWVNIEGFVEEYPDIDIRAELFEVDRDRFTCAGGVAALDMALSDVSARINHELAVQISDQCMHERMRQGNDNQRLPLHTRLGINHPKLLKAILVMEQNTEYIVSRDEIADEIGLSRRQLERLFRRYLNTSPARYYLRLRLNRARNLLSQTSLPITEIAFACGFSSASHFSKCYREMYSFTPRNSRFGEE